MNQPWIAPREIAPQRPLPKWPRVSSAPYEKPSDGSTLVLLKEPSGMTRGQLISWANFQVRRR